MAYIKYGSTYCGTYSGSTALALLTTVCLYLLWLYTYSFYLLWLFLPTLAWLGLGFRLTTFTLLRKLALTY